MKVSFTSKMLLSMFSKQAILDCFSQQQGAYMNKHKIEKPPVKQRALKRYSKACYKLFRAKLALCKTAEDYKRLHSATYSRLSYKVAIPEFLPVQA
jgi:hypothetical protein